MFFCKVLYLRLAGIEFQSLGLAMWKALFPYMQVLRLLDANFSLFPALCLDVLNKMEFRVRQDKGWGYVSSKTMSLAKFWFNFTGVAVLCFCRYMYQHICVSRSLNFSVKVFQITDLSFTILATSEHSESEHSALTVKNYDILV